MCVILLVSAVCCAPVDNEKPQTDPHSELDVKDIERKVTTKSPDVVEIVESGSDHKIDGSYSFHYRGADGSFREETAVVKNAGTDHEFLEITGAYSYFDTDDKEVVVHYKADDHGFVPVGNNIPEEISVAAKKNSQSPGIDGNMEDEIEDEKEEVLKMPHTH